MSKMLFLLCIIGLFPKLGFSLDLGIENVFGVDLREAITTNEYPGSTIGFVSTGCTGTLVGRNLVVTAAHCVVDDSGKFKSDLQYFYPNMIADKSATKSYVNHIWWGTSFPQKECAHDWAVLKLDNNLGDQYGWMKMDVDLPTTVNSAGYSQDLYSGRTATIHKNCAIVDKTSDGLLLHNCHTATGASGGPVFWVDGRNKAHLVAINVAEYRENSSTSLHLNGYDASHANIAISIAEALEKIRSIQKGKN